MKSYASRNARLLTPLGLMDSEFEEVMRSFYASLTPEGARFRAREERARDEARNFAEVLNHA